LTDGAAWGPDGRRAALSLSFDNLGEVSDIARGRWPEDEPLGRHFSVTRALPRVQALLQDAGLRATFFVEGRNAELYPEALRGLADAGHEVAYHGWCHESWAGLDRDRESELLARGRDAMRSLGIELTGFRPPGGRLTDATLRLLAQLGFTHCSPAGRGVGVRDGIVLLPFAWPLVDAYHVLPRFGALRERDRGTPDPLAPEAHAAALRGALEDALAAGRHLRVLFHPFLLEDPGRLAVLREHLQLVRALVDGGALWCAPHGEVAASLGTASAGELRLDPTPV
jgi:peptidoglycan/xylan/chitin deacetylase (PgdA/CDA1 family)